MREPIAVTTTKVIPEARYQPTQMRLYGVPIGFHVQGAPPFSVESADFSLALNVFGKTDPNKHYEMAVIYGYAYEGCCYSLPKPSIVVVDKDTRRDASGCGYEDGYADGPNRLKYYMWSADKLDKTLELSLRQGFFEDIILDQNINGQKAPSTYSMKVQLAHRGGKLMD
jgi:hypothetical protein